MISLMKKIIQLSGKYKWRIYLAFVFSFAKSMLMNTPICLSFIALCAFLDNTMSTSLIFTLLLIMAAAVILQVIFQNIADRLQSAAGYLMFADLRNKLGSHLRKMPMGYFTEGNIGKISSVLSTDMVFVEENCMMTIADLMSDVFAQIIMIGFVFGLNFWLGMITLLLAICIAIIGHYMEKNTMDDSVIRQEQSENLTEALLDYIEGIGIIKSYNLLGTQSKEVTDNFKLSCDKNIQMEEHHTPWQLAILIAYALATTVVLTFGYYLYSQNVISLAYFIGLLLFIFRLYIPLKSLYSQITRLTVMSSCVDRMNEVFQETELENKGTSIIPDTYQNEIEFNNVFFGYGKKEVLHDINFDVQKNTMIALVGPSGSGKSTIASLLARFWDIKQGEIKIKGVNIKDLPLDKLMDQISMVFQRVYLFDDTIYNNIAISRPEATEEEVIEAAKKAHCYDFIMALPDGFQTVVRAGGVSLSGGEKQRISIARCILKDAPIIILDEATASVDVDNESYIQDAINELCKGKTLLVIAHRLNTIAHADRILVIDDGQIVQDGKHQELIKQSGLYQNFVFAREQTKGWNS